MQINIQIKTNIAQNQTQKRVNIQYYGAVKKVMNLHVVARKSSYLNNIQQQQRNAIIGAQSPQTVTLRTHIPWRSLKKKLPKHERRTTTFSL